MAEEDNQTVIESALLVARAKFDAAMAEIAPYFGQEGDAELTDLELLEQSTAMTGSP